MDELHLCIRSFCFCLKKPDRTRKAVLKDAKAVVRESKENPTQEADLSPSLKGRGETKQNEHEVTQQTGPPLWYPGRTARQPAMLFTRSFYDTLEISLKSWYPCKSHTVINML